MRGRLSSALVCGITLAWVCVCAGEPGPSDFTESHDTLYNSLTIEKRGSVVEMRARSRRGEFLESAVDLSDPLKLVVPYTRSLYAALFFEPNPECVLMIGLGGAGFHRLFAASFPDALLQTVELDGMVLELATEHMGFEPTERTPVAIRDGRLFVKRDRRTWDWIILDAFRGGYVPPHLKTQEFYRECAARLSERGVFVTNLHLTTKLYPADLRTIRSVFEQVVLFRTANRGNVVALAVKYAEPDMTNRLNWAPAEALTRALGGRVDMNAIADEFEVFPTKRAEGAELLTDDFAPVEFLNILETNNSGDER